MKIISVSIDLDPLSCYYDIHGIKRDEENCSDIIYTSGLERIFEFFERLDIKPTLFVVGRELQSDKAVSLLKNAVDMGYEIANHSFSHSYNLSLLPEKEVYGDIERCDRIISEQLGVKPVGFRAPGYNLSGQIISTLIGIGYRYDSSVLPSPFYYFSKLAIITFYRLTGRETKSLAGSIRMPFSERDIYVMSDDIYSSSKTGKILEIPISVAGILGIPYVGTFIMGYRDIVHNYLNKKAKGLGFLHIELHGIDFIDRNDIRDERLIKSQFDLNVPLERKRDRLKSLIEIFNPEKCMRLSDFRLIDYIL